MNAKEAIEEVEVWLARDKNNALWAYVDIPNKCYCTWNGNGCKTFGIPGDLFPSIKWEDEEPTKAKIILEL